jgi:YVTN family beta-propeller protein
MAVSRDGRLAYVTSTSGPVGKVTVIGTRTNAVLTTINVGVAPFAVALSPHRCGGR